MLKIVSATPARLSAPAVHAKELLTFAGPAFSILVIADRRASGIRCPAEQAANLRRETTDGLATEKARRGRGVDSGGEERLVGVDVADAGKHRLVEKRDLDRPAGAREVASQIRGPDRGGVGAEPGTVGLERLRGLEDHQIAEPAGVDRSQQPRRATGSSDDPTDVFVGNTVRWSRFAQLGDEQSSGHAEAHAKSPRSPLDQGELLPVPIDAVDRRTSHGVSSLPG